MLKVGIERLEICRVTGRFQQVTAHGHQRFRATHRCIDAAQQFLTRSLHRGGQSRERRGIRRSFIGRRGTNNTVLIGPKLPAKHLKKRAPLRRIHRAIGFNDFLGEHGLGRFAAFGEQVVAEKTHIRAAAFSQHAE